METINIGKLKQSLSEMVRRVRAGESFTVMDRKTPVAILTAFAEQKIVIASKASAPFQKPHGITRRTNLDVVKLLREERDRR